MGIPQSSENYYDLMSEDSRPRFIDLAPDIVRQRMVLEGTLHNPFESEGMIRYCKDISKVLDMTPIGEPITDFAEKYGWCAYMHWKESGMHIYSWNLRNPKFFSIDIYTCKTFKALDVMTYTADFFQEDLIKMSWKE